MWHFAVLWWFTLFCCEKFLSRIYVIFSVKFSGLKICWCRKNDKCEVCTVSHQDSKCSPKILWQSLIASAQKRDDSVRPMSFNLPALFTRLQIPGKNMGRIFCFVPEFGSTCKSTKDFWSTACLYLRANNIPKKCDPSYIYFACGFFNGLQCFLFFTFCIHHWYNANKHSIQFIL